MHLLCMIFLVTMILNPQKIKKILEPHQSENATYQNGWDAAEGVLGGKLTALNVHIRKEEKSKSITKASTSGNQTKKSK